MYAKQQENNNKLMNKLSNPVKAIRYIRKQLTKHAIYEFPFQDKKKSKSAEKNESSSKKNLKKKTIKI